MNFISKADVRKAIANREAMYNNLPPKEQQHRKAVMFYALELLDSVDTEEISEQTLLNGARDWLQYSEGGCSLVADYDIAERILPPENFTYHKETNFEMLYSDMLKHQAGYLAQAYVHILVIRTTLL